MIQKHIKLTAFRCIALLITLSMPTLFAQPLELLYLQRPPYSFEQEHQPKGLIMELFSGSVKRTNVEPTYKPMNDWGLVLKLLKKDTQACYVGSYKTTHRETLYKFSEPLYRERPTIVVTNMSMQERFKNSVWLAELLNSEYWLGVQIGFSYGDILDQKLKSKTDHKITMSYVVTETQNQIERNVFALLAKGRIDYVFMNAEEYWWNKQNSPFGKMIGHLNLNDNLDGNFRYLMCSKAVDDQVINQINHAVTSFKLSSSYHDILARYHAFN